MKASLFPNNERHDQTDIINNLQDAEGQPLSHERQTSLAVEEGRERLIRCNIMHHIKGLTATLSLGGVGAAACWIAGHH